jgi:hypothetical protein
VAADTREAASEARTPASVALFGHLLDPGLQVASLGQVVPVLGHLLDGREEGDAVLLLELRGAGEDRFLAPLDGLDERLSGSADRDLERLLPARRIGDLGVVLAGVLLTGVILAVGDGRRVGVAVALGRMPPAVDEVVVAGTDGGVLCDQALVGVRGPADRLVVDQLRRRALERAGTV